MDIVNILLFMIPLLVWYFCGYVLNERNIFIDDTDPLFLAGLILSGISIYLTTNKLGHTMKIMYPFLLVTAFEGVLSEISHRKDINNPKRNKAFIALMMILFINSMRIYVQVKRGVLIGSVCLIIATLIITIKFIN